MSGAETDYEVAIVGCGPVGALAANLFGRAGVRTLVIEREAEPYPLPRAVHIDHEMMRLFQSVGLADAVRPLMREAHGHIHIGADGGVIRYLGSAGLPQALWLGQRLFLFPARAGTRAAGGHGPLSARDLAARRERLSALEQTDRRRDTRLCKARTAQSA